MTLKEKAVNAIKKYSMLHQGDSVLIGLSGGPDSICLSAILDELKDNFNLSLQALYVNHGLRPEENKKEEAFCREFCGALGIKFYIEYADVREYAEAKRLNLQEAARELRYGLFEKVSLRENAGKIAMAHNADDQAETVIMRLIRGSGRKGLSGMPPVRGKIIRPFIDIQRAEIEGYLKARGISFVTDSSNLKTDYLRNRLRMDILPLLKAENPSFTESICRAAEILRDEDQYLQTAATKAMMRLITRKSDKSIELFLIPLMNINKAILRRVLRRALSEIGAGTGIGLVHIDGIIDLVHNCKSGDSINLPKGIRAIKNYSTLVLTKDIQTGIKTKHIEIPGKTICGETGLMLTARLSDSPEKNDGKTAALFDYERLALPLQVRSRRDGDYFYPAGFGKRKKLQDFLVDLKVPREMRDSVPVVVSGEDIIWVAGYRMDGRFAAGEGTRKFLILRAEQCVSR